LSSVIAPEIVRYTPGVGQASLRAIADDKHQMENGKWKMEMRP
jgi:hypothetical protein